VENDFSEPFLTNVTKICGIAKQFPTKIPLALIEQKFVVVLFVKKYFLKKGMKMTNNTLNKLTINGVDGKFPYVQDYASCIGVITSGLVCH